MRILGPIEIERDGRLIELSGRRERAVVALLLVRAGRTVPLDRMVEDLWDGAPPSTAVTSLRSHVSRVRKALAEGGVEDLVVTRDAGYALRLDGVRLDAADFEASVEEGRRLLADGDAEEAARQLATALRMWRGAPFGELGSSGFARSEVARLEEAYKSAREDRIEADLMAGRHREVAAELDALTVEEPLRERLWGQRMLALYRSGRQAEALRTYTELRSSLAEHLGILPCASLQQLEVSMLCQDPMLDLPTRMLPPSLPPAPAVEPPRVLPAGVEPCVPPAVPAELRVSGYDAVFVGRARELARLEEAWERAQAGTAQRVFLAGEPGIGKTTLAAALATKVHSTGGAVLLGRCDRDALTPYQPFVEALRRFVQTCSVGCLARQSTADLREVGRLVPELVDRVPGLAPLPAAEDADRFRLFEGVTSFITTIAAAHPVLLVLDDLHWADKPTALLLRHLARRVPAVPLLLLGTYRDVEVDPEHPMAEVLADLRREQGFERVSVQGLDPHEIGALVTAMAGPGTEQVAPDLAGTLHRDTGGNPFFVREVVRHLQGSGGAPGEWSAALARGAAGSPDSIKEVVGRRVGALSELAAATLALAAVVGTRFDLATLEEVGDLDPTELLDVVDEAAAAGLVVEEPRRPGGYAFTHALIREVLYSSLSLARRGHLHHAVGTALKVRAGLDAPTERELAHHFLAAGPIADAREQAVEHSARAGAAALEQLAYEEAVAYLERALDVQATTEAPDPASRVDLLLLLGHAHWRVGASTTRATFEQAATEARALGDGERFARAVVGLGLDAGGFASSIRANEALIAMKEEALVALGPGDSELRVRLMARLAIERYFTPQRAEGLDLARDALTMAERLRDDRSRLVALHAQAWASFVPSEPPSSRLAQVAEITSLAHRLGDHEMAYRAEVLRQQTLLEIGDLASAEACCERMEQLVSELRMPRFTPWVCSYQATRAFLTGELAEADRLAAHALDEALALGTDSDAALALIGGQQMALRIHRSGMELFADSLQAMAAELEDQDVVRAMLPVLYRELDRPEPAREAYRVAVARRAQVPRDATWLVYAWALGVSCRFAGGVSTAADLYDELLPFADRWAVSTPSICFGPVSLALAGYASVLGWHDAALAHAESGLASARAAHAPVFVAAALAEQAEVLLARGQGNDVSLARGALNEAAHLAVAMGLTALLARIRRLGAQV